MRRVIWFLVAAMALLVLVLMLSLGTPPAEQLGALIGGCLQPMCHKRPSASGFGSPERFISSGPPKSLAGSSPRLNGPV